METIQKISNINAIESMVKESPSSIFTKDDVLHVLAQIIVTQEQTETPVDKIKEAIEDILSNELGKIIDEIHNSKPTITDEEFSIDSRNCICLDDYSVDNDELAENVEDITNKIAQKLIDKINEITNNK